MMGYIGKTFKSKTTGFSFYVKKLFEKDGELYYLIIDLATNEEYVANKKLFEKGYIHFLEELKNEK